ncbi:MAG: glycosyltransferase family 39 protein [Candidatus Omnitrophica bacterium]|nr:glycosyltransferase family 39 protein [Candidatus Omnitrophota bacterium]
MSKRLGWGLAFLILAGLALRLWRLPYGLPHIIFSDEGHHIYWALNMGGGDLNPHQFVHPTLFFYLCFAADCAYTLWGMATGLFQRAGDAWTLYRNDPTVFYLIGRLWSVFFGTLTIPLVFWTGRMLFNTAAGMLAAAFLAFSLLHVQYSQIAYLDVPLTFFVLLSLSLAIAGVERRNNRLLLCSAFFGGLSASIKYNGLAAAMFAPLALLVRCLSGTWEYRAKNFLGLSFLFGACFLLAFTIGTPYWLLDFSAFKRDVLDVFTTYNAHGIGQIGYDGGSHWRYYLSGPLSYGLSVPVEIAALGGLVLLLLKRDLKGWFLAAFPLTYFVVIGMAEIRGVRYAIPLLPFMCLFAACFTDWATRRLLAVDKAGYAAAAAGFLFLIPSLVSSLQYAALKSVPDTREAAAGWIEANVPARSGILVSSYMFLPDYNGKFRVQFLDPTLFDTRLLHRSSLKTLADFKKEGFDYLVLDEWHEGIVLEGSDQRKYQDQFRKYAALRRDLETAELMETFSPYRGKNGKFDMENIDFPSRAIGSMKSMGPKVRIYKLTPA